MKEPGTRERTAFHQDATYFEIEGEKCCVLWIPADPVTLESGTILYVRGSHRDGKLYEPNVFIAQTPLPGAQGDPLPDIEGHMDQYDIIHFDVEPGDVIVHHYRTIHGAGGNHSRYQVRRAASLRYCGDDIRFQMRPWTPKQLHHTSRLRDVPPSVDQIFQWFGRAMPRKQPNQAETQSLQASATEESVSMPPRAGADRTASLKTIEVLLDYAILESAELSLPLVVCLLRMARLELGHSLGTDESTELAEEGIH